MPHFDACISLRQASTSAGFMPTARHRWYRHRLQLVRVILFTYRHRVLIYENRKREREMGKYFWEEEEESLQPNFPPRFLPIYLISENFLWSSLLCHCWISFNWVMLRKKRQKVLNCWLPTYGFHFYYDLLLDSVSRASLFFYCFPTRLYLIAFQSLPSLHLFPIYLIFLSTFLTASLSCIVFKFGSLFLRLLAENSNSNRLRVHICWFSGIG